MVLSPTNSKLKFISPADMQIEWRPLYRLVNIYIDLCSSKNRLYRFGSYVYR